MKVIFCVHSYLCLLRGSLRVGGLFALFVILASSSALGGLAEESKPEDGNEVVLKGDLEWRYCPEDKPIKGNVNFLKNTKIYHLPSGAMYKRTNPEVCFDTKETAVENGFRASER
jgi:hypothetical protein